MSNRGKYGTWDEEIMEKALAAYRNGDVGLNCKARTYSVPKATLKRQIDGKNINAVGPNGCSDELLTCPKQLKLIY
jgi:hypothetical protein